MMSGPPVTPGRAGLILALFCAACMLAIVLLWQQLEERIVENRDAERVRLLRAVLGDIAWDNDLLGSELRHDDTRVAGVEILRTWQAWRRQGPGGSDELQATVIEARAPNGYSGPVDMLIGIDASDRIIAVRVVGHRETPGLGDQIDHRRSDWIEQFSGVEAGSEQSQEWRIRQDGGRFDKISGATITSRAMVQTVAIVARWHSDR